MVNIFCDFSKIICCKSVAKISNIILALKYCFFFFFSGECSYIQHLQKIAARMRRTLNVLQTLLSSCNKFLLRKLSYGKCLPQHSRLKSLFCLWMKNQVSCWQKKSGEIMNISEIYNFRCAIECCFCTAKIWAVLLIVTYKIFILKGSATFSLVMLWFVWRAAKLGR